MRLAQILIHPREVMRDILAQPRDRAAIPIVLASGLISSLGDANVPEANRAISTYSIPLIIAAVAGLIVLASVISIAIFYVFGVIATYIGRFFEGTGDMRRVRSALAWGLAPMIWSVIYRLPLAFVLEGGPGRFRAAGNDNFVLDPGRLASGCGAAILVTSLELAVISWCVYVSSNTLGEAHGFSSMRGFATYLLSVASPIVVVLAAVLTMVF